MKRRKLPTMVKLAIGAAVVLAIAITLTLSVKRYREPQAAPPEALAHIAEKNREAAIIAAAHQRAESAASTNAAEDIAEARRQGSDESNASLARFADGENQIEAIGRRD